jgi:plastocyanin
MSRLLFVLVIPVLALAVVACGGSAKSIEALATEAADVQPSRTPHVVARGLKFDTKTIVVPARTEVSIEFENRDAGTVHNISVYRDSSAKERIYEGELFRGSETKTYTFTSPDAGAYYFRCDAHPDMNGAFVAK